VATSRVRSALVAEGVALDALVGSGGDRDERYTPGSLDPAPRFAVATAGSAGGTYTTSSGEVGTFPPAPLPAPLVDTYGAGDSFAAGLTFGLGAGYEIKEALALAARCGAACLTGRGPYPGQLRLDPADHKGDRSGEG